MIHSVIRRWLSPICLIALIAAVWALPHRPDCDSLVWVVDPAIARVDSQCILLFHYADSLHIIETNIKNAEIGMLIGDLQQALKEGEAHLESLGLQRYWQEILPAKLRREMAILNLEEAILEASADGPDGPHAEVPRLAWLAYQERVFEGLNVELTRAAPQAVSIDGALAYLAEVLQGEQEELSEEYGRRFGRR